VNEYKITFNFGSDPFESWTIVYADSPEEAKRKLLANGKKHGYHPRNMKVSIKRKNSDGARAKAYDQRMGYKD